jgi:hypothetical protein
VGYSSKGRKPIERASKITHAEIVNNPTVRAYLQDCTLPSAPEPVNLAPQLHPVEPVDTRGVRAVIAIDGGFTETYVREEFPAASIAFFTFGPLLFKLADLRHLDTQRFIAPEDLAVLKHLQRHTLTLPIRGVRLTAESSLASSIRRTLYGFFTQSSGSQDEPLIHSLAWILFRRWEAVPDEAREEHLEHCPYPDCEARRLPFRFSGPTRYLCPSCQRPVYLTDVLRLHEWVDEEQGAGGILTYLMTALEQIVLVHMIRTIWGLKRALLAEVLLLKDGPLAFFGLVAGLYKPMREFVSFLLSQEGSRPGNPPLYLAGVEKSGAFVDHAAAIEDYLPANTVMIPDDAYIYRYIIPGGAAGEGYGVSTYYGRKVFFKSAAGAMHVLTVPMRSYSAAPTPADLPNLHAILQLVAELRCSMYDNALVPIALANKLVSLSDFPSKQILTTFAQRELA